MRKIKLNERDLHRIVKRTINEKQELKEGLNCSDFGAQDCTIDCCRDREGGDGIGRKMGSIVGCTTGGACAPFDACADGTSSCVDSVRRPNDWAIDAEREMETINESQLTRIIKRTINERRVADEELYNGKVIVCVKGGCYDWNKTSDSIQCSSHGGNYECFKGVRGCRNNC